MYVALRDPLGGLEWAEVVSDPFSRAIVPISPALREASGLVFGRRATQRRTNGAGTANH